MNPQTKIHIPHFLSDNRKMLTGINPVFRGFALRTTTINFQVILLLVLGAMDYMLLLANGITDKTPQFLVFLCIDAASFFLYVHFIFPKLSSRSYSLIAIVLIIILCMLLYTVLHLLTYTLFASEPSLFLSTLATKFIVNPFYHAWQRMVFSLFLWSAYEIKNSAKREQVLETNILFSRISPHLLFNALNMLPIESSVPLKNDRIIELLSRYTRNAMTELGEDGKGLLTSELDQLETLLLINELRFGKIYIQIHKELPSDITDYRIPPQIIVTLAENVFKYGIVDDPLRPAVIMLNLTDHFLTVRMTNYKYPIQEHPSGKHGINSVQKRLHNMYGRNHHFKISETAEVFSIEIGFPV
ncbi:histidine kinase [Chitinophaga sp. CF418]|uniref:histidine kinase n=1 Tax=Chitinophaga sp. CF418 TaxID=1855287 RepID=UPI000920C2AC|nr:histidine kinase [Chitinophaga sp. CF418]SHN45426.1 Histidine kinase [Chitinophaga sp. CF418]